MSPSPASALFSAELISLKDILEFLRASAQQAEFSPQDLDRLDLIVEEIAVNICRHAYPEPGTHPLRIDCRVLGKRDIFACIADRGAPFDPLSQPAPDLNVELKDRQPGGLGIFLATHLAQEILYERSEGWNRLSFRFSSKPDPQ